MYIRVLVPARMRFLDGQWIRRLRQPDAPGMAPPCGTDVVLAVDAALRRDPAVRTGPDAAAVRPLRLDVARDRDAVTSSLADDLASSFVVRR